MPAHPIEACYCHVIEAGLANIARHSRNGARDQLDNETRHLQAVTEILTAHLLYWPNDPRYDGAMHKRYWNEIRTQYISLADEESRRQFEQAWEFLALIVRVV